MQKMEMITLKYRYKMKKIIAVILFSSFYLSCKKHDIYPEKQSDKRIAITKKDSLLKIKDTTLFVNSSEGEEVKLFINTITKDSVIESEVFGEMGKSEYRFLFNKNLKIGECKTSRYSEPISINSDPKTKSEYKENLSTSKAAAKRLQSIFISYRKVFYTKKITKYNKINTKWLGKYYLTLNEDSDDWRNQHEIELNVTKDSITYLAKGYQLYQYYNLSAITEGNFLVLKYERSLDNTDSWALQKTKDFGNITFEQDQYIWSSPYIDINFSNGNKKKYDLKNR
jgi:hypothetical protein